MDFVSLNKRLEIIRYFYLEAAKPFISTAKKLLEHSPDGEAFRELREEQWEKAYKCLEILGQCSLGLLKKALHDYLRAVVIADGGPGPKLSKTETWLDHYCRFLQENTSFSWTPATTALRDRMEQIILARNDFEHGPVTDSDQTELTEFHLKKQPESRFIDQLNKEIGLATAQLEGKAPDFPALLSVPRNHLFEAIGDVQRFCQLIEMRKERI
jgi:hypothetical protein